MLARQRDDTAIGLPRHLDGAHLDAFDRVGEAGAEVAAAKLTVGEDVDPRGLLAPHGLGDLLVLDQTQLVGVDHAGLEPASRLEQALRTQQTADLVSTELA